MPVRMLPQYPAIWPESLSKPGAGAPGTPYTPPPTRQGPPRGLFRTIPSPPSPAVPAPVTPRRRIRERPPEPLTRACFVCGKFSLCQHREPELIQFWRFYQSYE